MPTTPPRKECLIKGSLTTIIPYNNPLLVPYFLRSDYPKISMIIYFKWVRRIWVKWPFCMAQLWTVGTVSSLTLSWVPNIKASNDLDGVRNHIFWKTPKCIYNILYGMIPCLMLDSTFPVLFWKSLSLAHYWGQQQGKPLKTKHYLSAAWNEMMSSDWRKKQLSSWWRVVAP